MHACTVLIKAVCDRVLHDGRKRPKVGHVGPEAVASGEVRRVELARLAAVEFLIRIIRAPRIHIGDLRSFGANYAPEIARWHLPRASITRRNSYRLHEFRIAACTGCPQLLIDGGAAFFRW